MSEQNQIALRFWVFCGDDIFQTSDQESWNSAHPMHSKSPRSVLNIKPRNQFTFTFTNLNYSYYQLQGQVQK